MAKTDSQPPRPKIGALLKEIFVEQIEVCPSEAHRALKKEGRRTSYQAVLRLFYDLRQLGLIEFSHSEPSATQIDRRYYRMVPSHADHVAWKDNPHHVLYPSSRQGALKYGIRLKDSDLNVT